MCLREPDIGLRTFDYVRNVSTKRVIGRKPRVREIEVRAANHSKPLHQPPAWRVGRNGERDDAGGVEIGPRPLDAGAGRFYAITLPPRVFTQPPADLDVAVDRPLKIIADSKAAITEQCAVGFAFDRPEAEAMVALAFRDAREGSVDVLRRGGTVEVGRDRRRYCRSRGKRRDPRRARCAGSAARSRR